ncbi:MAG: nitrous oxide-stimulated promoter family protein [Bacillota bacterium]|jgi:hypothetical protein|nr:nitrous oxide-stimulated promoter family protein [Clostridia bacterium]
MASLNSNRRIRREKKIIKTMIELYCRKNHGTKAGLCPTCGELLDYAFRRLDKCKFGGEKPVCNKCRVHCYQKDMREKVRQVMRFSGPRMIYLHPVLAAEHFFRSMKRN